MALTSVTLKSYVFLTLEDAKDWCKIPSANTDHDGRVKRLLNTVTDMCEKYINGPIKTRSFVEYKDGDSSNVIVPDYFPVRSVTEVKVDASRVFGAETTVNAADYYLRGTPDINTGILGSDIVLRGDDRSLVLPFTGDVLGSIKVTYTAGWGADQTTLPSDLVQAVLMGVEYFFRIHSNSDLNINSRGNMGSQSYSKSSGLPKEVTDILDEYTDYTLGRANVPQKNSFSI